MINRDYQPSLIEEMALARDFSLAYYDDRYNQFIDYYQRHFPDHLPSQCVVELGCACADITTRFAEKYPSARLYAIEPLADFIFFAKPRIDAKRLHESIRLFQQPLTASTLPLDHFNAIISYQALHRVQYPADFWSHLRTLSKPGTRILVADLIRPESVDHLHIVANQLSKGEPDSMNQLAQRMLFSAFSIDEVRTQLKAAKLDYLAVENLDSHSFAVIGEIR